MSYSLAHGLLSHFNKCFIFCIYITLLNSNEYLFETADKEKLQGGSGVSKETLAELVHERDQVK